MAIVESALTRKLKVNVLLQGNNGPKDAKCAAISNEEDWNNFFETPPGPMPKSNEGIIVAIALGQRPSLAFKAVIKSSYQITSGIMDGAVHLNYYEEAPTGIAGAAITYPFVVAEIIDLFYYSFLFFHKVEKKSIVLRRTVGEKECRMVPEGSVYTAVYSKVYGPDSEEACLKWMSGNCKKV